MPNNIQKIIDTDAGLRTETEWLEERKNNLNAEIAETKKNMLRDLMAKADAEIAKKLAAERRLAENKWNIEKTKYKKIEESLLDVTLEKRDEWSRMIFERVTGESDK